MILRGGDDEVRLAGEHPQLGVVEEHAVDLPITSRSASRAVSIQRFIESRADEAGAGGLPADLALELGLDVAEEEHLGGAGLRARASARSRRRR